MTVNPDNLLETQMLRYRTYMAVRGLAETLARALFGLDVRGVEHVPLRGPAIIACTHASFIDPILLAGALPRPVRYLMYRSFYESWAKPVFQLFDCIPIDEKGFRSSLKAGLKALDAGSCVGIFPEGAVSYDGNLLPPKTGALFLAQRSGAPVAPAAISGNHATLPRGTPVPRLRRGVHVTFLPPFTIERNASREAVETRIDQMMNDLAVTLNVRRHATMPPEFAALQPAAK